LQGFILAFVVAYGVSTFVVHRTPSGYNTVWDGWIYTIAETLPLIPVLLRVRRTSEFQSAWLAMAAMIALNTIGDLVYTFHDQNLNPIPDPAPSDVLYLLSYAAFIAAVVVLTQSSFGRVHASVRLDGAIAGMAMGALAGVLWFEPLLHASGRLSQVAVTVAYPLCDLVLIGGRLGTAPLPSQLAHGPSDDRCALVGGRGRDLLEPEPLWNLRSGNAARRDLAHGPFLCRPGGIGTGPSPVRALTPVGQLAGGHHRSAGAVRIRLPD
jgi:hypothetical protein